MARGSNPGRRAPGLRGLHAPPTAKRGHHPHLLGARHEKHVRDPRHAPEQGLSELLLNTFAIIKVAVLSPLCWLPRPSTLPEEASPESWDRGFQGSCHVSQVGSLPGSPGLPPSLRSPVGRAWGLTQSYSLRCQS